MNNHSIIVKKESLLKKIINKIKMFFKFETIEMNNEISLPKDETKVENMKNEFLDNLKVQIDTQDYNLYALKIRLESGEIKAIDLTDEQIEKLQEIYDEEIKQKKLKLENLKKSA